MKTANTKEKLKTINQSHTYSKRGLEMIDELIDKSTFICFVHKGVLYDYDNYTKISSDSFTEPFQSGTSRKISDFTIVESLARLIAADQPKNFYWVAVAYADREIISDDVAILNASLGFSKDDLMFTQKLDSNFSFKELASHIISQPFISFGVIGDTNLNYSTIQFACLDIQDGDTFLFIA